MILEPTATLMLHSKNLNIKKVYFDANKSLIFSLCTKHEILTVSLGEELPKSAVRHLNIEYDGVLADDMTGFYRSSYKMANTTR